MQVMMLEGLEEDLCKTTAEWSGMLIIACATYAVACLEWMQAVSQLMGEIWAEARQRRLLKVSFVFVSCTTPATLCTRQSSKCDGMTTSGMQAVRGFIALYSTLRRPQCCSFLAVITAGPGTVLI